MSKLFKLKQWLTIEETAKHLSNVLAEPVNQADVLNLGLDRHLILSVNFVNSMPAKKGKIIHIDEASYYKRVGQDDLFSAYICTAEVLRGTLLHDDEVFEYEGIHICIVQGVWDLPMIGDEMIDIERYYNKIALGVELDTIGLDGFFVSGFLDSKLIIFQLQESFDDCYGYEKSRDRQFDKLIKLQLSKSTNKRKGKLIALRQDKYNKCNEQLEQWRNKDCYYPARKLPDDSVLCVRTSAIQDFLNALDTETTPEQTATLKPTITRENDFNSCLSEVISSFIDRNEYPPTPDIVLYELRHNSPICHIVNFYGDTLSINGAKPRTLDNVKRTIKMLLSKT